MTWTSSTADSTVSNSAVNLASRSPIKNPKPRHKRESIEARLNIVFAALAITRLVEDRTGWSIRKFVRTAGRPRWEIMLRGR
jgi:hypothetical protein